MKTRISKKSLAAFPANVAAQIEAIAKDYGIKSFSFAAKPEGWKLYAGEGDNITVIYGEGVCQAEMVSENNIGGAGLRNEIGAEIALPAGAFAVVVGYYAGYYMTVYNAQFQKIG